MVWLYYVKVCSLHCFFLLFLFLFSWMSNNLLFVVSMVFLLSSSSFSSFICTLSYGWAVDTISLVLSVLSVWISLLMLLASMKVWWYGSSTGLFLFLVLFLSFFLLF